MYFFLASLMSADIIYLNKMSMTALLAIFQGGLSEGGVQFMGFFFIPCKMLAGQRSCPVLRQTGEQQGK
ncbi:hypothetical protein DTL42_14655 [Bremerella cremea]|uniref:Uncharacterized protein n=1 Tax=Bremerella cremea TaxID=1031537 RepID=A0A368KSQ9_9BACT|nr:hypothetical protein DTL42_14655 [Bremerella cremea]